MTQEDKQLLLVDICGRLPYGICANLPNHHLVSHKYYIYECNVKNGWTTGILNCAGREECYSAEIEDVQPYLRPISSMTKEEKKEFLDAVTWETNGKFYIDECEDITFYQEKYDWLNAHHFDYRGLIEKGLAISTEEFNPYKD